LSCDVSVVVPTVDRVDLLARCLRGLAAQRGIDYEVVVVHDGDPRIEALLADWSDRLPLRAVRNVDRGASSKRNIGWRTATAPVVAFTDDDCEPTPGWARGVVAAFADPDVVVVQGPVAPHPDDADVTGPFARTVEVTELIETFPAANLSVRRTALERVAGFDESLRAGEDTDLAWRVRESGGDVAFAPDALVWHAVREVTFAGHLRSLPRWGDLPLVVRRHPQLRRLTHSRYVWKRTHVTALPALVGAALTPVRPIAAVAALPHVYRRVRADGVRAGCALAVADLAEVAVLVAGSARHRCVLL
jgi:GT2 family glycosyltransferase